MHQQGFWQPSMMPAKTGTGSIDVHSKRKPTISVLMVKGEACPTSCLSRLLAVEAGSVKTSVKFLVVNAGRQIYADICFSFLVPLDGARAATPLSFERSANATPLWAGPPR